MAPPGPDALPYFVAVEKKKKKDFRIFGPSDASCLAVASEDGCERRHLYHRPVRHSERHRDAFSESTENGKDHTRLA